MSREYKPQVIEKTIQEDWIKNNKFKATPDDREKFYSSKPTPVFVETALVVVVFLYEKFTKSVQR